MRTSLPLFIAWSLLFAAGPAAAQPSSAAPSAAEPPAQPPAESAKKQAEPPRLMLRLNELDGPRMSFGPSAGEKSPPKDLPSLGGDARAVERATPRDSAYPDASRSTPTPY